MKQTFVLPVAFLLFTAVTTVLIKRRARVAVAEQPKEEYQTAAG